MGVPHPKRKTNLRSYRPGGGEFSQPPGNLFDSQGYLRGTFMEIVWWHFPKLRTSLRALYNTRLRRRMIQLQQATGMSFFVRANQQMLPVVVAWGKRWRLTDDWCGLYLLAKVYPWLPSGPNNQTIEIQEIHPPRFTPVPFQISGAWDPTEKTAAKFKAEMRQNLDSALDTYLCEVRHAARAAGFVPNPELRQANHLRWLAAYQVGRLSPEAIARMVGSNRQPVRMAIHATANRIGLTLRNPGDYEARPPAEANDLLK